MNIFKPFTFFLMLVVPVLSAHSLEFGRTGDPYEYLANTWQDIYIKGAKFEVTGSMPGSPHVVFINDACKIESIYQDVYYWIQTSTADDQKPPKNVKAFMKEMAEIANDLKPFESKKPSVVYAFNYSYKNKEGISGITRIYVSKKKIYILGVLGDDHSLANDYFKSFDIQKE